MTRHLWFHSDPGDDGGLVFDHSLGDPEVIRKVTVREPDHDQVHAGIWVNARRSPDTWILVDGRPRWHSPAPGVGEDDWALHEARGGARTL